MSDKKLITEELGIVIDDKSSLSKDEIIEKINDICNLNSHKTYDTYNIAIREEKNLGYGLIVNGVRQETDAEQSSRESIETIQRKALDEAELKEYLRLKRKYGKG